MRIVIAILAIFAVAHANVREYEVVHITHIAPKNLDDLLKQFAAFIPFDKCIEIVEKYYKNNSDVQAAYNFLTSDEFAVLANKVEEMPEYQNFLKYLYDSGLDIYTYRNILRGIFGLPPIDPIPPVKHVRAESGIILMVREILGVLPIDEIKQWYINVCEPDPNFQEFLRRIRSQEFIDLVDKVHSSPEYVDLTNILRSQGIDVDEIEKVISDFINNAYRKSIRTLKSLVDQFKEFIPETEITNIIIRYYLFNADVKKVVNYLRGEEFKNVVVKVEGIKEFKDFLAYVYSHDIDIYAAINKILDLLNLPNVGPMYSRTRRYLSTRSGLTDMIDEIKATLPLDQIAAWYKSTCEPDPEFQDLLAYLRSDDFKVIVNAIVADPAYTSIRNLLIKLDIDVVAVENFLNSFFGW